jgi:hypothetical protein
MNSILFLALSKEVTSNFIETWKVSKDLNVSIVEDSVLVLYTLIFLAFASIISCLLSGYYDKKDNIKIQSITG